MWFGKFELARNLFLVLFRIHCKERGEIGHNVKFQVNLFRQIPSYTYFIPIINAIHQLILQIKLSNASIIHFFQIFQFFPDYFQFFTNIFSNTQGVAVSSGLRCGKKRLLLLDICHKSYTLVGSSRVKTREKVQTHRFFFIWSPTKYPLYYTGLSHTQKHHTFFFSFLILPFMLFRVHFNVDLSTKEEQKKSQELLFFSDFLWFSFDFCRVSFHIFILTLAPVRAQSQRVY